MDIKTALANGNGQPSGKLRLSLVLEGTSAQVVRQALVQLGVERGGYRGFVREAILHEIEARVAKAQAVAEAQKAIQQPQPEAQPQAKAQPQPKVKVAA